MDLTVLPSEKLSGSIKAPPSKSYTIRALTAALLAEGASVIKDPLVSEDTKACMLALKAFGGGLKRHDHSLKIDGVAGEPLLPHYVINALNSGTTFRLMTSVASLCSHKVKLTGDSSLQSRPIQPLLDALKCLGVESHSIEGYPPIWVKGPLKGGNCKIPGDVSSQFISSLLMSLPCARKSSELIVTGELKSTPYIDLTLDILNKFGIRVTSRNHHSYIIAGDQTYSATEYTVEGDYSSAAFILGAAALTESQVTVKNLFDKSLQADRKFISILQQMGVDVKHRDAEVIVNGNGQLKAVDVDLHDSPDLLPITAALMSLADGTSKIYNVAHAREKECDRIKAMYTELKKMGANIEEKPDGLVITGGTLKGGKLMGWRDHRIVMALTVAALKAKEKTVITDAEYIDITFPTFPKLMKKIGAVLS